MYNFRIEMLHFGVSVHTLEPGFFKTPLLNLTKSAVTHFSRNLQVANEFCLNNRKTAWRCTSGPSLECKRCMVMTMLTLVRYRINSNHRKHNAFLPAAVIKLRNEQMLNYSDSDISPVINAYYSALTSRYPQHRYHPGDSA